MSRPVMLALVATLALASCDRTILGPEHRLQVMVVANPEWASVGEVVELIGIAYNPTSEVIEAGRGCSPGIGFFVTDEGGVTTDLYEGPWLCPLRDNNRLEPGETDLALFEWTPGDAGVFEIRSAVLTDAGPRSPSPPVRVIVE